MYGIGLSAKEKEEMEMKLTKNEWLRSAGRQMKQNLVVAVLMAVVLLGVCLGQVASAQAVSTTTVQGTVYLANGQPGTGTLRVSWPAFSTANGQAVAAGSLTTMIPADGFVSLNLAPNLGATPAGLYYTAVFYMSDGTSSTQYWVIPAAAQASLAQVQSQVMPAAQAVQAVNKAYVDQAIRALGQGVFTLSGGTLTGPLYLNGDPTQALQAADKHYVDTGVSQALPLAGGAATGPLTAKQLGAAYQVDQFPGADFGAKLQACLNAVNTTYGGTCDARNFSGTLAMGSNLRIATGNITIELPCATIATANQVIVTAGTRNVTLRGCALRGGTQASGALGGTVFAYSGTGAMVQVGDPTYAVDTQGFHLDNVVINTTAATSATAQGLVAYRTQEMDLESLYFLGNANQTGMTLDGTANYTGGTYYDVALNGFQTAVNAIGHQVSNAAVTDWMNASTFVRLHINCPTSGGNPIAGTYGINLQQGDGNTFTGGDVEGCATALHLGAGAQNNTIVGLRNENSTSQVVADTGSAYNNWITGGTMFTGKLTDNGTRNSFLDTFHRSFNGMNGDWYLSQQDATLTNHYRLGTALGNERGLLNRYQTDYGYRWTMGLSDATAGEQFYQVLDELNNVYRLSIGQYNNGQTNTNNQTVINAAGTGSVLFNGSTNAGTGGVVFASGGSNAAAVATINNAGNAQFNGSLQVGGTSTFTGSTTIKNQADAEINHTLWAGATASQKESLTYKDWNGTSQWYALKDASNNWALNSATGGLDSFKAYQSTNSGDTYINASNATGVVRVNYETGAGAGFKVYGGSSSALYASFTGTTSIQFPGLAAGSGHYCLQIDNSGYVSNTGSACGSSASPAGTINTGDMGQIAYYSANGTVIGGVNSVPLTAGGTGAVTAAAALQNLGGISSTATTQQTMAGPLSASAISAGATFPSGAPASGLVGAAHFYSPFGELDPYAFGAKGDGVTNDRVAIQSAMNAAGASGGGIVRLHPGTYMIDTTLHIPSGVRLEGMGYLCCGSSVNQGSIIYHTGTDAALTVDISIPGEGFNFGISNLAIVGANNNDNCINLLGSPVSSPRTFVIHDIGCWAYGGTGIYITGMSYGLIEHVNLSAYLGTAKMGIDIEPGGLYTEVSKFHDISSQATTQYGIKIAAGNELYFDKIDVNDSPVGVYVGNGAFGIYFDNLNDVRSTQAGIEITGETAHTGRIHFNDTTISMAGFATSEKAIYEHGSGYLVINTTFDGLEINNLGTVNPTNQVVADSSSFISFLNTRMLLGIPVSIANANAYDLAGASSSQIPMSGYQVWSHGITDPDLYTNFNATSIGLSANTYSSGGNYHAQTQNWTTSGCFGVPGVVWYGDLAAGARNSQSMGLIGCITNPNPWGETSGNELGQAYFGEYTANAPHFRAGFINAPDSGALGSSPAFLGYAPGTTTPNFEALNDGTIIGTSYLIGANTIIPSTVTGYQGTSGTKVQLSDGTGTSGSLAVYAADGSLTNGLVPPSGSIVGTSDTQTLINKTIDGVTPSVFSYLDATSSIQTQLNGKVSTSTTVNGHALTANVTISASDLATGTLPHAQLPALLSTDIPANAASTSGTAAGLSAASALPNGTTATTQTAGDNSTKVATTAYVDTKTAAAAKGGTAIDSSSSTGVAQVASGVWSVSTALPSGTTATTQTAGDNSTKVATTAYVDTKTAAAAKGGTAIDSSSSTGVAQVASGMWSVSTALPSGTTATTQTAGDNSTKVATTAYVATAIPTALPPNGSAGGDLSGSYPSPTVAKVNGAAVPVTKAHLASDASGHIVAAANTLGCLDGYDHLPCTVFVQTNVSESTPTGSYATAWTSTYAGTYRITGYIYGTTASSTAYSVSNYVKATQAGQSSGNGYLVASAQIGATISSGSGFAYVFPLNAGTAVQTESLTASGSNTGGVWSHAIVIERVQ